MKKLLPLCDSEIKRKSKPSCYNILYFYPKYKYNTNTYSSAFKKYDENVVVIQIVYLVRPDEILICE